MEKEQRPPLHLGVVAIEKGAFCRPRLRSPALLLLTVANFHNNGKIWISCVDKALLSDGKNTIQAKQWFDKCYSDSVLSETTVKRWYADFKRRRTDTNDAECLGHTKFVRCHGKHQKTPQTRFGRS